MAKIVDPDSLNQNTEVYIYTDVKAIQLVEAGNLSDTDPGAESGVTGQALYSFLKEEWQSDSDLNVLKFPIKMIYEAQFEFQNDWLLGDSDGTKDAQSIDLIRDAGFRVANNNENYAVIVSLGSFATDVDLAYYQQVQGFDQPTTDFDKSGEINEPVLISDSDNDLTGYLKLFLREYAKLYDEYNLLDEQGLSSLTYAAYKLPLANEADINVSTVDSDIEADSDLATMTIDYITGNLFATHDPASDYVTLDVVYATDADAGDRWYRADTDISNTSDNPSTDANWVAYPGEKQVGTAYYAYNRIIDFKNIAKEDPYQWVQWQLRLDTDINDNVACDSYGTVNGNVAKDMLYWVGDKLTTRPGVFIANHNANDQNDIDLYDITVDGGGLDTDGVALTSTKRQYPFVAAGNMVFSTNLVADCDAVYWMYFETAAFGNYNSSDAVLVKDQNGSDITGSITAQNISFTFDYDYATDGGRTPGSDAPVAVAAMGLDSAEWVDATFTITRATGLSFPVNAADERNYSNP